MINDPFVRVLAESNEIDNFPRLREWINDTRVRYYIIHSLNREKKGILIFDNVSNAYFFEITRYYPVKVIGFIYCWDEREYNLKDLLRWCKDNL